MRIGRLFQAVALAVGAILLTGGVWRLCSWRDTLRSYDQLPEVHLNAGAHLDIPTVDSRGRSNQNIRTVVFMQSCGSCTTNGLSRGTLGKISDKSAVLLIFGEPTAVVAAVDSIEGFQYLGQENLGTLGEIWRSLGKTEALKVDRNGTILRRWPVTENFVEFVNARM